ncbi:hypothetical protein [Paenibacillus sp. sgz500958]|uniref:hypothetical protein n=1 Tax=Paenibacillus sp. sgz500958 TaxID=3242475 RepID=UPI0036D3B5BE
MKTVKMFLAVVLIVSIFLSLSHYLDNKVVAASSTSKASSPRGKSGGTYSYKNIFGVKAGTYTYYNSEESLMYGKAFKVEATLAASTGTYITVKSFQVPNPAVQSTGKFMGIGFSLRAALLNYISGLFYDAAAHNGSIVYTTTGNIIVKIEQQ